MSKKRPPLPEGDDGRTIASMNVEGMPWYVEEPEDRSEQKGPPLTRHEALLYAWSAVKGGLLIFLVYAVVFAAVIWFIGHVWGA